MATEQSEGIRAAAILARLDRLPGTRHVWKLIALLSLGGMFEFYDLFMTAYVVPGLMKSGLLANVSVSIFAGPAFRALHMFERLAQIDSDTTCGRSAAYAASALA